MTGHNVKNIKWLIDSGCTIEDLNHINTIVQEFERIESLCVDEEDGEIDEIRSGSGDFIVRILPECELHCFRYDSFALHASFEIAVTKLDTKTKTIFFTPKFRIESGQFVPLGKAHSSAFFIASPEDFKLSNMETFFEENRLYIHDHQMNLVKRDFNRPLVIQGVAGSGKSTVGIWRALHLAKRYYEDKEFDKKILISTYNVGLKDSLKKSIRILSKIYTRQMGGIQSVQDFFDSCIDVDNVDAIVRKMGNFSPEKRAEPKIINLTKLGMKLHFERDKAYITGNTYPSRAKLKSIGMRWNPKGKNWYTNSPELVSELKRQPQGQLNVATNQSQTSKYDSGYSRFSKVLTSAKEQANISRFLQLLPDDFYEKLFEYVLYQKEITFDFLRDMVFHNQHVIFTAENREQIWRVFVEFEKLVDKLGYLSFTRNAINCSEVISDHHKYDHIIIDEAQDLSSGKLEFLLNLAASTNEHPLQGITILFDPSQSIYNPYFSWPESLPISMKNKIKQNNVPQFKSQFLKSSFRNPPEITYIAESVKEKMHRSRVEIDLPNITDLDLGKLFYESEYIMDEGTDSDILAFKNKEGISSTVWKHKGKESSNIVLSDFTYSNLDWKYKSFKRNIESILSTTIKKSELRKILNSILIKCLEENTKSCRENCNQILADFTFFNESDMKDELRRAFRYMLKEFDDFLSLLYVAITRTQHSFTYCFKNSDSEFARIMRGYFNSLMANNHIKAIGD